MGFIYGITYFFNEICRKPIPLHPGLGSSLVHVFGDDLALPRAREPVFPQVALAIGLRRKPTSQKPGLCYACPPTGQYAQNAI